MMLMTQKQLLAKAEAAGYGDYWEGYVMDKDLAKCGTCGKWGMFGEEITGSCVEMSCEACDDKEAEARTDYLDLLN